MSQGHARQSKPRLRNSSAVGSSHCSRLAASTIFAPASASPSAASLPKPREAPVTIATRPFKENSSSMLFIYWLRTSGAAPASLLLLFVLQELLEVDVVEAHQLGDVPVRPGREQELSAPRLGIRLGILDRDIDLQSLRIGAPDALHNVQVFAMRMTRA